MNFESLVFFGRFLLETSISSSFLGALNQLHNAVVFTRIRDRLPLHIHEQVFQLVLSIIDQHGLLKLKSVGVDSTLLEANAAMKSIVRKDSGEDWKAYLKRLMQKEGLIEEGDDPSDEDLRKFDKTRNQRGKKQVSNAEWESPSDAEARIVKMKDGRTHLGYKAEHFVDLEHEIILSATVHQGTQSDAGTLMESVVNAQRNVILAGSPAEIEEVAADKGYHKNETIMQATRFGIRTYIPEPNSPHNRKWTEKPEEMRQSVINNRRRMSRAKGKDLQKQRSEKAERSFAHLCETGGARRTWLKGLEKINKRYQIVAAARNLGLLMLKVFGIGKPRSVQGGLGGGLVGNLDLPDGPEGHLPRANRNQRSPTAPTPPAAKKSGSPAPTSDVQQIRTNFNGLLGRKLFAEARLSMRVPSTEKCSLHNPLVNASNTTASKKARLRP